MQITYGLFDSASGDERIYIANQLAAVFRALALSGVTDLNECLKVTPDGDNMQVRIAPGSAIVYGYAMTAIDDGGGVFTLTVNAGGSNARIDRLILRLDLSTEARSIQPVIKTGTPAASPQPPALTRSGEVYEISLARIYIAAGATVITAANITDERADEAVCGAIVPAALRLSTLGGTHQHSAATASQAGFMSAAQAQQLAGLTPQSTPSFAGANLTGTLNMSGQHIDGALFR